MRKIKVLFPYVEAGFGHIIPMGAIERAFREKYGEKVEIISSRFFNDSNNKNMKNYEKTISNQVKIYNRCPFIGFLATALCSFWGTNISSFASMRFIAPIAYRRSLDYMRELSPDVVISTHWATNYYAEHINPKPLTIMYCPDAQLNELFEYRSDLTLISMPYGYLRALRRKNYNIHNMKMIPFFIRSEAFGIYGKDKKQLRKSLGLDEDKFTVILAEGGYGIGKIESMCRLFAKSHTPLTVIAMCGTNEDLKKRLEALKTTEEVTVKPYGFTDKILSLEAASDVFCGKSGNILAEATFFGVPTIVTHFANSIERNIADHYINTVGCCIKEFSPKKAVRMVENFALDPSLIEPYREAALSYHENFGAEKAAEVLWDKITEVYPELK